MKELRNERMTGNKETKEWKSQSLGKEGRVSLGPGEKLKFLGLGSHGGLWEST